MSHHVNPGDKIITLQELKRLKPEWSENDKKIVFTNGCFDILHRGHVDYLEKAAGLGDVLVIGLNSDASVSRIKGPERPLQDQSSRAFVMASLQFVDYVIIFDEDTPL